MAAQYTRQLTGDLLRLDQVDQLAELSDADGIVLERMGCRLVPVSQRELSEELICHPVETNVRDPSNGHEVLFPYQLTTAFGLRPCEASSKYATAPRLGSPS